MDQHNSEPESSRRSGAKVVHLPIAQGNGSSNAGVTKIRASRMGRRRALVLAAVQLLMIAHVVQWVIQGETTTPIEPSESMEFVKRGVVNAGLLFFVLAMLSTLVLGRWFCGWGCHLVLLQDLCGWIMKKAGIRPRPFRSRLLVLVPLALALYMFVWPAVLRWVVVPVFGASKPLPDWQIQAHLTTPDFWQSFAGVWVAIPFLFVCGFATVYFLGSKGFCTYGCPYGGFFAPLDRLSPARIRVTDACEHCGHCTAVCTSNVRVHEEVRDFGMVVDPGCMKCLDCVSVCPNDALYFGFGTPSLTAAPRVKEPSARRIELAWSEEIGCLALFAALFFAFRGLYNLIPMLFAVGIAGCGTFILWKTWRLLGDRDSRFHRFQLRRLGRFTPAGAVWLVIAGLLIALTLHGALIQYHTWHGVRLAGQVPATTADAFRGPLSFDQATADRIGLAEAHLKRADSWREGGLGLFTDVDVPITLARLNLLKGRFEECERQLRRGIEIGGATDVLTRDLSRIMMQHRAPGEVIEMLNQSLAIHPRFDQSRETLARLLESLDRAAEAEQVRASRPSP